MRLARREIMLLREWNDRAPDPVYLQRIAELDRWIATLAKVPEPICRDTAENRD